MARAPGLIGVLGGMGPLATLDFLQKLLAATPAGSDQEHVPTVTWNVPQIPDRQQALAGLGASPLPAMREGIARLNAAGASRIVIPCNTAHLWFDELDQASQVPLIHIVDATLASLSAAPTRKIETVGLVATRGALNGGLYQSRLAARGIPFLVNTEDELDNLFTPGCYAIKSSQLARGGELLQQAAQKLIDRGASRLVLACTEVPVGLAHINSGLQAISIDPTQALADACIAYWNGMAR
ncbi:MAG: aspartate/glutamate racemase family protein [Rhodoferax sp.]